jgi:tape measure domain-containing protein
VNVARLKVLIDGSADGAQRAIGGIASGVRSMAGAVVKWGGIASAAIGGIVSAKVIRGGIDRQLNIEDAQAQLRGLGHDAESVQTIMSDALAAVKGTAFGLDEAATTAATAVAAGIRPGQELERYLRLTSDAATIAGTSMGEMGQILNKMTTSGRVYTQELNQLADRGLPVFQWLQEEYGVTAEELRKMVSAGEVDAARFREVMERNIGGAALASGDTTRGAFKNLGAAMSRLGVIVTGGVFPLIKDVFGQLITIVDGVGERIEPVFERLGTAFQAVAGPWIDGLADRVLGFIDALLAGEGPLTGLMTLLNPVGAVLRGLLPLLPQLAGTLGQLGQQIGAALAPVFPVLIDAIGALLDAVGPLLPVLGEAFAGILALLAPLIETITPIITMLVEAVTALLPPVMVVVDALAGAFLGALAAIGEALEPLLPVLTEVATVIADVIAGNINALMDALLPVLPILGGIIADLLPPLAELLAHLSEAARPLVGVVGQLAQSLLPVLGQVLGTLIDALAPVIDVVVLLVDALAPLLALVGELIAGVLPPLAELLAGLVAPLMGVITPLIELLAPVLQQIGDLVVAFVVPAVEVLTTLLGGVLGGVLKVAGALFGALADKLGLVMGLFAPVIDVVMLLVDAFAPLHSMMAELVAGILLQLADLIAGLIEPLMGFIAPVLDLLVPAVQLIGDLVVALVAPAVEVLTTLLGGLLRGVMALADALFSALADRLGLITSLLTGVGERAGQVREWFGNLGDSIRGVFTNAGQWLLDAGRRIIEGLMDGLRNFAAAPVNFLRDLGSSMLDGIRGIFGIRSPSRAMAEVGGFLMAGLAGGIAAGEGQVARAWGDVADLIAMRSPRFTPADLAAAGGWDPTLTLAAQGGWGGTVINIDRIEVAIPAGTTASDAAAVTQAAKSAVREAMAEVAREQRVAVRQMRGR